MLTVELSSVIYRISAFLTNCSVIQRKLIMTLALVKSTGLAAFTLFLLCSMYNLVHSTDTDDLLRRVFNEQNWNYDEIYGYHFHTYFFQNNIKSISEALRLRDAVQHGINEGFFPDCRLGQVFVGLRGPHVLGNFETCCNVTSFSSALSFFMLNHGNLSVLLHPITRYELEDHTTRSMFLGPRLPIDTSILAEDLGEEVDLCFTADLKLRTH